MRGAPAGVTALILAAALAGRASAAGNAAAAREQAAHATVEYNLGHYQEAARAYEQAYRLVQDPSFLFNIGQSHRLAGDPDSALAAYRAYLREAAADAPKRELARRRVDELEHARIGRLAPPPAAPTNLAPSPAPAARVAAAEIVDIAAREPAHASRWWLWAGLAVVAAGAVTAVALSQSGGRDLPRAPLGNQDIFR
jgi:tetratricopeptide (TPR) repeat protein